MHKNGKNRREKVIYGVSITDIYIPSCIFNKKLSSFETIVKFLKESNNLSITQISELLDRKKQSVWRAYKNAVFKFKESFDITNLYYLIPIKIIHDSRLSLLETLVAFMKEHYNLSFSQIAAVLMRDDRTIWTAYKRSKRK